MTWFLWLLCIFSLLVFAAKRTSIAVTTVGVGSLLLLISCLSALSYLVIGLVWTIFIIIALMLNITLVRQRFFSQGLLKFYRKVQPHMSATEKEAIAAGTVDWDAQLFSGKPDWQRLLNYPTTVLTAEEQAFLDGPVTTLCRMIDDWQITHYDLDIPPAIWDYLKKQGFFALIIPKEYGGKGFSAYAHASIIIKVAGISITVSSTISVPNSLGPAELLLHYGTRAQKDYYLPRLASGEEIPCFALTAPTAGSDASAMPDKGIVCKEQINGQDILGIRVTWNKRYITLAPVATVLGLAFKLYDPEGLLGKQKELGITCALIPVTTKGVEIGRRHFPLNTPFQNGPTQGRDVFIPLDNIIGGAAMAGQGWRMLMECLAAGRAISLPSAAIGGSKAAVAATGAYAALRQQFKMPIGQFEGIQQKLAEMVGLTYIINAAGTLTTSLIDSGQKPAVLSAIVKLHTTEIGRIIANHAMDIHGGKGICLGPHNYLGSGYRSAPISITVEGANILTRNMIIFGQGAVRCHPYALLELDAANETDPQIALTRFDEAIWGHIGYTLSNIARAFIHGITGGYLLNAPSIICRRYCQKFGRFSAAFALLADMSMLLIGSDLKRREMLSARLGDILSYLYLASAVIKQFDQQGRIYADYPLVAWSCLFLLDKIQEQIDALLQNYPKRWAAWILRLLVFPLGKTKYYPDDDVHKELASIIQRPSASRSRLIEGAYLIDDGKHPIGKLETTLQLATNLEPLFHILQQAYKKKKIQARDLTKQMEEARALGYITQEELEKLQAFEKAVAEIIAVDDFSPEELLAKSRVN